MGRRSATLYSCPHAAVSFTELRNEGRRRLAHHHGQRFSPFNWTEGTSFSKVDGGGVHTKSLVLRSECVLWFLFFQNWRRRERTTEFCVNCCTRPELEKV